LVGISQSLLSLPVLWHAKSEFFKNINEKAEGYEALIRKLK
jgi:hypothetical protein